MAILNRSTLKQKISDLINRVAPFTDPLIQKNEDLEVREDVADSVIFKDSTVASISSPGANFSLDFATNDEYNVDTSASIPAAFNITLSNLRNNSVGKINITKKTNDVFTFANGQIVPFNNPIGQTGSNTISLNIFKVGTAYFAMPLYNTKGTGSKQSIIEIGNWNMNTTENVSIDITSVIPIASIRDIASSNVTIISDSRNRATNLINPQVIGTTSIQGSLSIEEGPGNTTLCRLRRVTNGFYDSTLYESGVLNRGYITINSVK